MMMLMAEGMGVTEIFSTAITGVQTDIMSMLGVAMPIALAVAGVVISITFGIRFFKKTAKP